MSNFSWQNFDQEQNSNIIADDNFENDDLITFQHDSKKINIYYSQLTKYSKHIRESYLFLDAGNRLSQEIKKYQEEYQLLPENIDFFIYLSLQNYDINEDLNLTYIQCIDLLKLSELLEIRKLSSKINQYIQDHNIDVDFIIQMIQYEIKAQKENEQFSIKGKIENLLASKIDECFTNEQFIELPIYIIYRVVKKCSPELINNNKLFDIIMKSINKFCVLFQFLDLQKISEDRIEELCEAYSKLSENNHQYFDFLKCNLNFIKEMNKHKKSLQEINKEQQNKMSELEIKISQMQDQLNNYSKNSEQQNKMSELETKIVSLQKQFSDSEQLNNQLQDQLNISKKLNIVQENKISELETKLTKSENEINNIHGILNGLFQINGQIVASVENNLLINAEINLKEKYAKLDTSKSKFIICTSNSKSLGIEAYEKGELITSLNVKATFLCKPGTYYVRCIVFDDNNESFELISNRVTTQGTSVTFGYQKPNPSKILLLQGQYKLEVWGAKGGDSTGKGSDNRKNVEIVKGGLGGYSCGILDLKENTIIYVYVGGEGIPSDSAEGSSTDGGFPDGGGTITGHGYEYMTVPGTGGGSTSIRIGSESKYNRVIVAGGGGGASGDNRNVNPGGFGGGENGGNCYHIHSLQSQGAGTQIGSTCGLSDSNRGKPGQFGLGADCIYEKKHDSGGGGGGGWYGGGSGGYGCRSFCSSGGGGSGWVFTESTFNNWKLGDSENASKFALSSKYYLRDAKSVSGNEEFPSPDGKGTEKGHNENGYAKITLI